MIINIGTRFYFAPEMLLRKGYDKKVDLWALGVYLYEMSSFSLPFLTEDITPQRF
jgi:serine/threonine protein kinase